MTLYAARRAKRMRLDSSHAWVEIVDNRELMCADCRVRDSDPEATLACPGD